MPEKNIEKYQQIIEMLKQGKKHSDIISELGCSFSTIQAAKLYQEQTRIRPKTIEVQENTRNINGELLKIQEYKNKIQETDTKAEEALKNAIYGEYFRLKYIVLELTIKFLYYCYKRQPAQDILELYQIITQIEGEFHQKICDPDEFNNWRILRNRFIHEGIEITKDLGNKSVIFFNSIINRLNQILEKFIQPKFDYHGTKLVKNDFDTLTILEREIGEIIPKNDPNGYSSLFGYSENDGYITILAFATKNINNTLNLTQKLEGLKELFLHENHLETLANWLKIFKITPVSYDKKMKLYLATRSLPEVRKPTRIDDQSARIKANQRMKQFLSTELIREINPFFEVYIDGTPQYNTRLNLLSQDCFIAGLKEMFHDLSLKYSRLEVKEIAEIISVTDKNDLIIKTLKEMLVNEEIKGIFFNSTQAIVFENKSS
jgi:hypothetical protein